ncbi:uncharacterized protein RCC_05977 [Ramularia collo-cygni]|uniref:Uncharacterized protein n=1 Tax=Ramularia collo-cygni TaxID=112498 RepID=A0A2D3V3U0_9PEZI|nr:uncharacterized protein RCC_05977 [Ramularia collo-cygni]CZT20120.1 uncharacterized protein RCC_05977 [Ramularia collo-cygni]
MRLTPITRTNAPDAEASQGAPDEEAMKARMKALEKAKNEKALEKTKQRHTKINGWLIAAAAITCGGFAAVRSNHLASVELAAYVGICFGAALFLLHSVIQVNSGPERWPYYYASFLVILLGAALNIVQRRF